MRLTDDLYAYIYRGYDNNCNSYIFANVLSGHKHIIIDPGHIVTPYLREPAFDNLTKEIEKDGLKLEDVGLVIITHAHPDHLEAARNFQEKSRALIAIHKDEEQLYKSFNLGKIDLYLPEGEIKADQLIQTRLEILHTPGHSPGEISIYWPEKKALAVGDVIFYQNTGRVDLPGGDMSLLAKSIEKLSKLDVEYLLCGHPYGHPGVIQGKDAVKKNIDFIKENILYY